MWRNWSIFKRSAEEHSDLSINRNEGSGGKENIGEINRRGEATTISGSSTSASPGIVVGGGRSNGDFNRSNYCTPRQANGNNNIEEDSFVQFPREDDSICDDSTRTNRLSPRKRGELRDGSMADGLQHRSATSSSPFTLSDKMKSSRGSSVTRNNESSNNSFSGVYGPLLSTPIVPKVRRALLEESSPGLRSPQTSALVRGKQVGRSASVNYRSGNPTKSTAGQVPWVRLKRRESLTLSDIVSGNTPHSPNTVKLAVPEPILLPSAPSFRTTPVIVTTDHCRARMVDTQTVVSALREKRKRFGVSQREDSFSEDSWINAAKRRRQDSSQSNASSVSIPSMPESLPNLMGTPGVSLLHIENMKDQRPSTVPAMDAFVSRHQREFGLGGEIIGHKPHQQVHNYQQLDEQDVQNKQTSKSVLRSIQSSLSSSLRTRSNLSILQQSGLDLNRIRQLSEIHDTPRTRNKSSDVSSRDKSVDEPRQKVSRLTSAATIIIATTQCSADKPLPSCSAVNTVQSPGTVSSQTKQKIADGVVLRKHNMSVNSINGTPRPKQTPSLNALVSTSDYEQDRQKEYKRRVLDLLDGDEVIERTDVVRSTASTTIATLITSSAALPTITSSSPTSIEASLAATSAAVSASLDSLNKLVQSATASMPSSTSAGSGASIATANTLTQLLKSSNGIPAAPTVSTPLTVNKDVSFGTFIPSTPSSQNTSTEFSTTSSLPSAATGGFKLGVSQITATSVPLTQTMSLPTTHGFNIDFSSPASSSTLQSIATSSEAPTAFAASMGNIQQSIGTGFNFHSGTVSSSVPNTNIVGSLASGSVFSSGVQSATFKAPEHGTTGVDFLGNTSQSSNNSFNILTTSSFSGLGKIDPSQGGGSMINSGITQGLAGAFPSTSSTPLTTTAAPAPASSMFNFGNSTSSLPSGFSFGNTGATTLPATNLTTVSVPSGFSFGNTGATTLPATNLTTVSVPSGFSFGNTGATTLPATNFNTVSVPSASSTVNSTSAGLGFNFGLVGSAPSNSHQVGGLSFGMVSTNASGVTTMPACWTTATSSLGASGITGQSANPVFKGYGSNTQTTPSTGAFPVSGLQPQSMFTATTTSASIPSLFGSMGTPFAKPSHTAMPTQQPFGSTTAPAPLSLFSVATTASNSFAFGQSLGSSATSNPFSFGTVSTQSGGTNSFGGSVSGSTVTTSSSVFGNLTSPSPAAGATSIFCSGSSSAFGGGSANSQFGSSVPTTAPPAFGSGSANSQFGSSVPTTAPPAFGSGSANSQFGSSVPTTAPPAFGSGSANSQFGSSVPTTAPPAFGSGSVNSQFGSSVSTTAPPAFGSTMPAFGATGNQTSSVFGAATLTGGQSLSMFGAPVSSSNQLFTFGSATGSGPQPTPQQAPTFGSNPTTAFASNPATAFASNPATAFGSNPATAFASNPATAFGSNPVTAFGSNPATAFGSNSATAFGSNLSTFGSASTTAFGSNPATTFGSNPANTFGSNPATTFGSNPANTFGSNPATTFGSNPASSFGNVSAASGSSMFGTKPAVPAFGTVTSNPTPVFGTPTQSASTAVSPPPFKSSFGMSTTFGTQQNPEKSAFGATATGFGTPATPAFGTTSQSSAFGVASQNPQQNLFGSASQAPTPAFGPQQSSLQTATPGSFGGASTGGANFFAAGKPNMFGATTTTQSSFNFGNTHPSSFNSQTAGSGFNFGQSSGQPASSTNMGLDIGAQTPTRPPFQAATGGFNFAAAASATPTFNFSGATNAQNPFNPETPNAAPRPRASVRRPIRRGGTRR